MTSPVALSKPGREEPHVKMVLANLVRLRRFRFQFVVPAKAGIEGRRGSSTEALDPRLRGGDDYPGSSNFDQRE
jgi:hypothetical protein